MVALCSSPAMAQSTSASEKAAEIQSEGSPTDAATADIVVIGSRSNQARSSTDTAAPVDIINTAELSSSGRTELAQQINFIAPSFNSAKQTISNGTDHIDPATLRGLGPDQTLLLINGKRQHTTALVNVNSTVGRGSVGYDLNTVPTLAVERIEVLRDGAAAQYGSDAIAGVINIALKKADHGFSMQNQVGITKQGDGFNYTGAVNGGMKLGDAGGFLNGTLQYTYREPTNRTGTYNNTVYLAPLPATRFTTPLTAAELARQAADNVIVAQRKFDRRGMIVGNAKAVGYNAFVNAGLPIGADWEAYSFGGASLRKGRAAGFYRYPNAPRTSNLTLFPDGFLPFIETRIVDKTAAIGIRRDVKDDWTVDLSTKYGSNAIDFEVDNTINASMGAASPTHFYAGQLKFQQFTTNADVARTWTNTMGLETLTLAFGSELRFDKYGIKRGQVESYGDYNPVGTPAAQILASGTQVFGGFRPSNEVDASRRSIGVYADIESDITNKLLLGGAVRYENYSDFGGNVSGKFVGRYKLSDTFAIRAGVNKGFRAPSLHQRFYSAVATQFITVGGVNQQREVTTVRNDSDIARRLGFPALKPETSLSYSVGITAKVNNVLSLTIDAYQIDIDNRIVISGRFSNTIPQLAQFFAGTNITEAQFFTNAIDTRTRGIDAVLTGQHEFGDGSRFNGTIALNLNNTKIKGGAAGVRTPALLSGFGETLLNREERGRIEVNQPRSKIIVSGSYEVGRITARLQATRFGEISTIAPVLPEQDQTFSPKIVTDISFGYKVSKGVKLTVGANNFFDVYPDKVADPRLTNDGTVPYSRFATQFGFNGASYFLGLNLDF